MSIHLLLSLRIVSFYFFGASCCTQAFLLPQQQQQQQQQGWRRSTQQHLPKIIRRYYFGSNNNNDSDEQQAMEALTSLIDFHPGTWKGRARSFTVTADVAAGILQRKTVDGYTVQVELQRQQQLQPNDATTFATNNNNNNKNDFYLIETIQGPFENEKEGETSTRINKETTATATATTTRRTLSLTNSRVDVDCVDASYSLDAALLLPNNNNNNFPSFLSGTQKLPEFLIEHCIATSDNHRVRCFALYGDNNNNNNNNNGAAASSSLIRVVVCEEERMSMNVPESSSSSSQLQPDYLLSSSDLKEIERDVNKRLVDKIADHTPKDTSKDDATVSMKTLDNNKHLQEERQSGDLYEVKSKLQLQQQQQQQHDDETNALTPHQISLLELSSGVWLGDIIIRDIPMVPDMPLQLQRQQQAKGFGTPKTLAAAAAAAAGTNDEPLPFASWSEGVQKVAWRLMWNFGDEIRQINDFGKSMGAEVAAALTKDLSGTVCVNEGLSRRIPADERMVLIDWNEDNVGFLIGSHSIQLPRYLNFDSTRRIRPFYTEFCTYQKAAEERQSPKNIDESANDEENIVLPEVVCSKISRVYNYQGKLKQGCSSFFTLKRFGTEI